MSIRTVALIGANGKIGPFILQALHDARAFDVSVLTRKSSKSTYPSGTKVIEVDDALPKPQLIEALQGQDALVIAFAGSLVDDALKLVDAAFAAGVQLVIPPDFGSCDSSDPRSLDLLPLYKGKKVVRDHLAKLSQIPNPNGRFLTWTSLVTGHFFDFGLRSGLLSLDLSAQTAREFDGGQTTFSATTLPDIGLATSRIIQHAGDPSLVNQLVYVHSIAATQQELLASVQRVTGRTFRVDKWSSREYIAQNQALLAKDDQNHDATEELVSVEGIVNADWRGKGDRLVNDLLEMPEHTLDELIKESIS